MQYMKIASSMRNATPPPAAIPAIAPVLRGDFEVEDVEGATDDDYMGN